MGGIGEMKSDSGLLVRRALAYLLDLCLVLSAFFFSSVIVMLGTVPFLSGLDSPVKVNAAGKAYLASGGSASVWAVLILALLLVSSLFILIYHGYFVWLESSRGQTLGKRLFGLRVVSEQGVLTRSQALTRDLLRYVDCALVLPGLILVLTDPAGRRLGDRLARTRVIREGPGVSGGREAP
jgi:uncharacterized RDD family membrane protein YckC